MISSAKVVQLMAPADIEGVLALALLESALLDNSQHYRRRVLAPRRHVSRDHIPDLPEVDGLIIHIDPLSMNTVFSRNQRKLCSHIPIVSFSKIWCLF